MLGTLFPRASEKCLQLPLLGPIIEGFEDWLVQQRYARLYIRALLRVVRKVDRYLRRKGIHHIEDITHLALHDYWGTLRRRAPWEAGAVHILARFLRMRGALNSCPVTTPSALQVAEYSEYLREVRGLTPATLNEQVRVVQQCLAHLDFDKTAEGLAVVGADGIEGFVRKLSKSLSRPTLRARVIVLRNFLRFLAATGRVSPDLPDQIDSPRVYKLEKLPRTLRWKTVQALLRSIPKTTAKGRRDYTMLFLIATYGLRSCEVVALTLDDVDWRTGVIRIRQTKTRNELSLPLTDDVARVLIAYLRKVPRLADDRNLFFQVRAPIRPLRREALRDAFDRWSKLSGLEIPFHGPHCIRHSYAVHLLGQGTSLKTIGDLLGHRRPESTAGYLRLATDQLREVSLPVPPPLIEKGGPHED
jgi:integrase/recombinase XerD